MKPLCLTLFAVLAALLLALPAGSSEYYDGYQTPAGFTYHAGDGYWWRGGVAYSRTLVSKPGYYYCGAYYAGSSYWEYSAANYTPPKASYAVPYTKDWKTKVLEVAAQRDDHAAYLQTLKALGLPAPIDQGPVPGGGYRRAGYGAGSPLYSLSGYGSNLQLGTYGANGQTIYGYSLSSVKDFYGSTDLNGLYQQAARLTSNAQQLAGQGNADFSDLVRSAGANQARVAEILAQAEAAARALNAAKGPPVTVQNQQSFSFQARPVAPPVPVPVPNPGAAPPVGPPAPVGPLVPAPGSEPAMPRANAPGAAFQVLIQNRCAACHSGKRLEGGFDIAAWPRLDNAAKARVIALLTTTDVSRRMPKGKPALTADELRLFLAN